MERNPWAKDGALDVPFAQLPKEEQDKDMVQYDVALTMSEAKFYDISNYLPQHVAQVVVEAKNRGENNVYKHNFSILFSEFDTAKTCFYKVHTRAFEGEKLWEKMRPIWREEGIERTKKLRAESVSRISEWQKRGESLVYPNKIKSWHKWVEDNVHSISIGAGLEESLEVMEALEQGKSIEEATKIAVNHGSVEGVMETVTKFSKRGPAFFRANSKELSKEVLEKWEVLLKKLEMENKNSEKMLKESGLHL
ncbi:MAG TPA: hypothetical protein VIL26_02360 [Clostridia bacterium]